MKVSNIKEFLSEIPRLVNDTWLSVLFNVAKIDKTEGEKSGLVISITLTM
jgi:hypothetical protein